MASGKENDHIVFKKEITLSHIITTLILVIAGFWFFAEQEKRLSVLENKEIYNTKLVDRMADSLTSIDSKMDKLISKFEFERGRLSKND